MTHRPDDVVKVAVGPSAEMHILEGELRDAGVNVHLVGDDLTAGLGTVTLDSVELWVLQADAKRAAEVIDKMAAVGHKHSPHVKFPHPESDPKPDRSRGSQHGAPPHRPLP